MSYFLFTIQESKGTIRKVRLQGSGGLLGNGCLGLSKDTKTLKFLGRVREDCLQKARLELERGGSVREYRGDDLPVGERIKEISPLAILDVNYIGEWA